MTEARARFSRASSSEMSISWRKPHCGPEHGQRRLDVDARIPGMDRERIRLGRGHPRQQLAVHEEAPYLLEGNPAHELLDIDPAISERTARSVGLGDLGRERDYAFKP